MLRLALTPKWMAWNVLTLGAMVTCALLAAWQWSRAGSAFGSALNVGYGLQWPVFAVFFGVMWWRMLRMESTRVATVGSVPVEYLPSEHLPSEHLPSEHLPSEHLPSEHLPSERVPVPAPQFAPGGPSPFTGRPRSPRPVLTPDENPQLTEYNRRLRELAAQDEGK